MTQPEQPSNLPDVPTPRDPALPGPKTIKLDQGVHDRIVEAIRGGVPVTTAAPYAGISTRSLMKYLAIGREECARRDDDMEPDHTLDIFVEFFREVEKARADAAVRNVAVLQKVAAGGIVTETTTRKYRDPDTGAFVEEKTEKRTPPDWRAAAHFLDRQHRAEWGKDSLHVELTGAEGGPVQIGAAESENLASRIAANLTILAAQEREKQLAAAEPAPQLEHGPQHEVLDGEVVEG